MRTCVFAACVSVVIIGAAAPHQLTAEEQSPVPPPRSEGVYTYVQAARGKALYTERCALCHLDDLTGDQLYNPGPPLAGRVFRARWTGRPLLELFDLIKTTMPLHTPGTLSGPEVLELVAYIFQANKFPTGSRELQPNPDELKALRVPGS